MKGKFGVCSLGYIGIITSDLKQKICFKDATFAMCFVGIALTGHDVGGSWCSRNPWLYDTYEEAKERSDVDTKAILEFQEEYINKNFNKHED